MKSQEKYFSKYVKLLRLSNRYPAIYTIDGPSSLPMVLIGDKEFLNFSSNNYLGLADNEKIKNIVIENIKKYGVGSGSTRMLSGTLDVQVAFEKLLGEFLGKDDSITFSSGFLANVGVIRMLIDAFPYEKSKETQGVILSDELNHASIIDGVRLAKAERAIYRHSDMGDLERILKEHGSKRKLIITDGVFSMDGDLAKLKEIVVLAKKYDALVMVDDSHAVGMLGPHGEGTSHHLGVEKDIDVIMGSFTKAYGSIGGFIAASQTMCDYLRITARSYIFSDPIIPSVVAGLIEATHIIKASDNLRKQTLSNAHYLRTKLRALGFAVVGEETTIVPLIIGSDKNAIIFSKRLYEKNIIAPCIRVPAVLEGKERMRFSIMATHTREQIDLLLQACAAIGRDMGIIMYNG